MILIAQKCLLLRPVLIVSGAFERTGREFKEEGGLRADMSWSYGMDG